MMHATGNSKTLTDCMTLFLCGDVMTGRGIDQVLPHPGDPRIHESYLHNAKKYVEIAEEANGPIPGPVDFSYIWGDALAELKRVSTDVRIINLETSITASNEYWQGKDIHGRQCMYRISAMGLAGIANALGGIPQGTTPGLQTHQPADATAATAGCLKLS